MVRWCIPNSIFVEMITKKWMEVAQYHVLSRVMLSTMVTFWFLLPANVINGKASKETVSIDFFNKNLGHR